MYMVRPIKSSFEKSQNSLRFEKVLSNIKYGLYKIEMLVSILYLDTLFDAGIFLYPIFESYNNLSLLEIDGCTIPYSAFVKLGVSFPKLKSIELTEVLLVYLPTDKSCSEEFISPLNLNHLRVSCVRVIVAEDLLNPHEAYFKDFFSNRTDLFKLPKIYIPSLKKLILADDFNADSNLEEFLDFNPNLEYLKVEMLEMGNVYNFNSLKTLEPENVACYSNEPNLPTQYGVKELIINIEIEEDFENITKLCELCPNLEKLQFRMSRSDGSYQQSFDNFLIPVLFKLPKVKTLILKFWTNEDDILDINEFPHIETIIFYSNMHCVSNLIFNNCFNLKDIEIRSMLIKPDDSESLDALAKMRNNHRNWDLKLFNNVIKGTNLLV